MSIATTRAEIAAALNAVDGVKGYAYRPKTQKPGDAWPTLPTFDLQNSVIWRPTWTVIVFLPQDEQTASAWMDTHFAAIAAALRSGPLFPETAEPAVMPTEAGDVYVLEITGRS